MAHTHPKNTQVPTLGFLEEKRVLLKGGKKGGIALFLLFCQPEFFKRWIMLFNDRINLYSVHNTIDSPTTYPLDSAI